MDSEFYEIEKVYVNTEIVNTNFTCNLAKCKGACCTMESDFGAPISKNEIEKINKILPDVLEYLSKEHVEEINKNGFWMSVNDELMTRSMNKRACVFVTWEGEIAKCSIEKAFNDGKIDFIKPVSCHLFPIRVSNFCGPVLRYEQYSVCSSALEKGNRTQIKILDFCRSALEREFGKEWFEETKKVVDN